MKTRFAVAVVGVFAFAISQAGAATITMTLADLASNGWKVVTKDCSAEPGASVTDRTQDGSTGFQFSPHKSLNNDCSWAGVTTANYVGIKANRITALNIRTFGLEGDGNNWQAPTFTLFFKRTPDVNNNRVATWLPWVGQARLPGQWNEYNALTSGQWYVPWIPDPNGRFASFEAMLAALPDLTFMTDAECAAWTTVPGIQSFNVKSGAWLNEEIQYFSSARGTVDWIEVGIDGVTTRYDFEPGRPVVIRGNNVLEPIMNSAKLNRRFTMFGKIIDSDYFSYIIVDDGSDRTVKVLAQDFVAAPGSYVKATGTLDNQTDPPTLRSAATQVEVLADPGF